MDLYTPLTIATLAGGIIGYVARSLQDSRTHRELLADKQAHIDHLAIELHTKRADHAAALQEIADMHDDAELGAKTRRQRAKPLAKAQEANAARAAAKVTPIRKRKHAA